MVGADERSRRDAGGQRADLDVGVAEQQPHQLSPGIPAGSGHRDAESHAHDYAANDNLCKRVQRARIGAHEVALAALHGRRSGTRAWRRGAASTGCTRAGLWPR